MAVDQLNRLQTIGNYELQEKIAEGGMGTVYRGRSMTTGDLVAVKVVPQHLLTNPVVLKRFEQEYNVARQIDHPNIVKALDFGRENETRYLVMEFVDGESLGQKIERDGRMNEQEAIKIITQVAEGLQKAHQMGLIHRDVKPDNVLINTEGQAKLTDLGLVKELEADLNLTRTGRGLGTPHFMAPEQFRNAKRADIRCDVYSLGSTLYMMVTGELPFRSTNGPLDAWMKKINNEIESPRLLTPSLSDRIDWAIRRAMSPDPNQRPASCKEFIEDLMGEATKRLSNTLPSHNTVQECWYLVYKDEESVLHTVKGTIGSIRRSLKEGLLGDAENIRVSSTKAGPFEPVRQYPEFRDLIVQPAKLPPPPPVPEPKPPTPASAKTATPTPIRNPIPTKHAMSESLSSTTLVAPLSKLTEKSGPRIHFNEPATPQANPNEIWKWVGLAFFFGAAGSMAALAMPFLRSLKLF